MWQPYVGATGVPQSRRARRRRRRRFGAGDAQALAPANGRPRRDHGSGEPIRALFAGHPRHGGLDRRAPHSLAPGCHVLGDLKRAGGRCKRGAGPALGPRSDLADRPDRTPQPSVEAAGQRITSSLPLQYSLLVRVDVHALRAHALLAPASCASLLVLGLCRPARLTEGGAARVPMGRRDASAGGRLVQRLGERIALCARAHAMRLPSECAQPRASALQPILW